MLSTPRRNIFSLVVVLSVSLAGCDSLTGKKAAVTPPTTTDTTQDTSTSSVDNTNDSGTTADASAGIPGIDKSCQTKDTCTPAAMNLLINPAGTQLSGVAGQSLTWVLTAVDTNTLGGVATPLPVATPPAAATTSTGSGTGDSSSSSSFLYLQSASASGTASAAASSPAAVMMTPNLAGASSRHVAMILSGLPADATVVPVTLGKPMVTATITWIPTVAGTGAITVILRDYDRCFVSEPDQTVCERSTLLPAYDVQHSPVPMVITAAKAACPTTSSSNGGFLGLPNLFGGSNKPAGC